MPLPNNTPLGAAFQCNSCQLENFHIDSDAMSRAEVDGGGGAEDTTGTNWLIEGMWVQHVESSVWASGSGGTVENNFFTVIFADGCNLNNVSLTGTSGSNLTATNNFIRGTGDDGMAINSVAYNGSQTYTAMTGITMTHNTVIAPWGGKGIGVYGGSGHLVADNFISDTARYIGLGVGRFGVNGSDMTGATVTGNVIVRSGGNAYLQGQPALQIGNGGDGQNVGTVTNATVTGNTIIASVYDSIAFSTSTSTNLADNTITSPWRNGIVISPPFYPAPTGNATITGNSVTGLAAGYLRLQQRLQRLHGDAQRQQLAERQHARAPTAGRRRRCLASCRRRTTTPAARGWPTTSPRSTAPPTATAPTASTWRPRQTRAAATTSAGPPAGSGSATPSTRPPPGPTPSASASRPPPRSPTPCTCPARPART